MKPADGGAVARAEPDAPRSRVAAPRRRHRRRAQRRSCATCCRRRLAKVVDDAVKLLVERTGAGFAGNATPEELATAVGALRPIARETTSLILAQEVERALRDLVDAGPAAIERATPHRTRALRRC